MKDEESSASEFALAGERAPAALSAVRPAEPKGAPHPASPPLAIHCGDCLDALAHRLAQPLTALRGTLELALRFEGSTPECRVALEQALEQADRLVRVLESLRDLAGSCAPAEAPQAVRLDELAAEIAGEWRACRAEQGVDILLEAGRPAWIESSSQRLREAISGTMQAVVRGNSTPGVIRVAVAPVGNRASLTITDERPGTPSPPSLVRARTPGEEFAQAAKLGSLEWLIARRLLEAGGGELEEDTSRFGQPIWRVHWPLLPFQPNPNEAGKPHGA